MISSHWCVCCTTPFKNELKIQSSEVEISFQNEPVIQGEFEFNYLQMFKQTGDIPGKL